MRCGINMWQIPAPGSAETVPSQGQHAVQCAGSGSSFGLITLLLITTTSTSSTIYSYAARAQAEHGSGEMHWEKINFQLTK